MNKVKLFEENLTEKIIAAAIEVHRILGPGFGEDVYEEAFAHELKLHRIPYERQKEFQVPYKDITAKTYKFDFLVDNKIIIELKAVSEINNIHEAQLLSYLKATNLKVGLILNFNVRMLKNGIKRLINPKI
jgi:GxxExxY protein